MADDGIRQISGRAKVSRKRDAPWIKKPDDPKKPCVRGGCPNEGHFIPVITVWAKSDPKREGRFVVSMPNALLCALHAVTDPREFVPDEVMLKHLTEQLHGEPDLESMVVQYVGNARCKVDFALNEALKLTGTFEPAKIVPVTRVGA